MNVSMSPVYRPTMISRTAVDSSRQNSLNSKALNNQVSFSGKNSFVPLIAMVAGLLALSGGIGFLKYSDAVSRNNNKKRELAIQKSALQNQQINQTLVLKELQEASPQKFFAIGTNNGWPTVSVTNKAGIISTLDANAGTVTKVIPTATEGFLTNVSKLAAKVIK